MAGNAGEVVPYRERMRARVQDFHPDDLPDIVAFRHDLFGPDAFIAGADYVRWLYDHPRGDERPSLWTFRSSNGLEGTQGVVRTSMLVDGRPLEAVWAIDLFVSPTYQLRGIGPILAEVAADAAPLRAGFEVTEAAKKAFLRAGWIDLGDVALFTRPLDVAALGKARGRPVRPVVARSTGLALRAQEAAIAVGARGLRVRLTEVARFDERSDELWAEASPQYRVIAQRDARTLNWRFCDYPDPDRYRCFYLERGDRVIGYAVLRRGPYGGIDSGWIVDFLCAPRWATVLLVECARWLRADGAQAVYCIHQPGRLGRAFAVSGFARRSTGWPLMVHTGNVPDELEATLRDAANWFITGADSNVDKPRHDIVYSI